MIKDNGWDWNLLAFALIYFHLLAASPRTAWDMFPFIYPSMIYITIASTFFHTDIPVHQVFRGDGEPALGVTGVCVCVSVCVFGSLTKNCAWIIHRLNPVSKNSLHLLGFG